MKWHYLGSYLRRERSPTDADYIQSCDPVCPDERFVENFVREITTSINTVNSSALRQLEIYWGRAAK
ncbi:hypothetical protein PROFUN_16184 [Planoprotostelium fungivorum]|uniref:Uncharacterized protein n=1 Tax=Planoprotostelium fungivorum TaxID=1890364 RepID=A0A2P6MS69_9EUKA|nr:hypothetical protein PROFUN_16184 [Planoprotostelium fungivorum]